MPKLTKTVVEQLSVPATGEKLYWDNELRGFGVRVTALGKRSYIAQGRVHGKSERVTIGPHGRWTCEEARKRARDVLRDMDKGISPRVEKKRLAIQGKTLREVMRDYLADRTLKPSSRADIEKHVTKSFKAWADEPVVRITRDMCDQRFRELSDGGLHGKRPAPQQANQAFVILRALLTYARGKYRAPDGTPILPENPVTVLSETKRWHRSQPRTGRIPDDKIGAVWALLHGTFASDAHTAAARTGAAVVAFLLLTGARWSEAAQLTWDRVNVEAGWWHLPDPKNRNPVTLPLSRPAQELLELRPRVRGNPYVFPARSGGKHVIDARPTMQRLTTVAGRHLTPHDLRRTFRAIAATCGIELWKTKLLMNHRLNDVTIVHYTDTSNLLYLRPEVNLISEWVVTKWLSDGARQPQGLGHSI